MDPVGKRDVIFFQNVKKTNVRQLIILLLWNSKLVQILIEIGT